MRRILSGAASTLGVLLAVGWFGLLLLVEVGGISYRKDCVNSQSRVERSWTVTWYAPIPFLFRPSEEGCEVHTGVRVAMNAVGLFPFKELNVADAAREAADDPDTTEAQAYYAELYAAMKDHADYSASHPDDLEGGIEQLRRTAAELGRMDPPRIVAEDHAELRTLYRTVAADGERMIAAIQSRDREAAVALEPKLRAGDKRRQEILDRISSKLAEAP